MKEAVHLFEYWVGLGLGVGVLLATKTTVGLKNHSKQG